MATITSNGTGGGDWSTGSTWDGGTVPGDGDRAIIQSGDVVYIDGDITIGDGTTTTTVYAVDCAGELVWRNESGDANSSWTFTVNGHMNFTGGRWYIGTEDNSRFGSKSVGPIPASRTATVLFTMAYYHRINWGSGPCYLEVWGAEQYHHDIVTFGDATGTVDSASDYVSFVDADLEGGMADFYRGAWLEITGGTNAGEKREITAYDTNTGKITWSSDQPMPNKCDSTSTYSIRLNFERALLQSDVSAGETVVTLDRPAGWQTGDYVIIGCSAPGYDGATNLEKVQITKVSATQFTCNLSYDHKAGDMVIHCARNVVFDCSLNGSSSSRGYYFNFGTSVNMKVSWCAFNNAGYSSYAVLRYGSATESEYPTIKNIYCEGWIDGSYGSGCYAVYINGATSWAGPTEEFQIENIHAHSLQGILDIDNINPDTAMWPLERSEKLCFRDLTLVGSKGSTSYALVSSPIRPSLQVRFYNLWIDGRKPGGTTREGGIIRGGCFLVDGFRCYVANTSFYVYRSIEDAIAIPVDIKNGVSRDCGARHIYMYQPYAWRGLIENVRIEGVTTSSVSGICCYKAGHLTLFLRNNKYNKLYNGLELASNSAGYVYEFDSEYGVESANNRNILRVGHLGDLNTLRYVSHNTKYVTPLDGIDPVIPFSVLSYPYDCTGAIDSLEAHNPILNGTPSPSVALVNGTTIVENVEHPTNPRSQSNIKLKITPLIARADNFINLRIPFLAYAQQGQTVTVSVYLHKNVSQEDGMRPKLYVFANGIYEYAEMTDVNDTWEQVSVSYVARYDGAITAWLACRNNYKYTKSDPNGGGGDEATQGTVVVYADELDISIAS